MRHRRIGRKLNRTGAHRAALFRNMTVSLFRHEQLRTTLAKAKELRRFAEPMITLGKTPSLANRRRAFAHLRDREIVGKLFGDLGVYYKDRPGGYLRILKSGYRPGDTAPMAIVQLVGRTPGVSAEAEAASRQPKAGAETTASAAKSAQEKKSKKAAARTRAAAGRKKPAAKAKKAVKTKKAKESD